MGAVILNKPRLRAIERKFSKYAEQIAYEEKNLQTVIHVVSIMCPEDYLLNILGNMEKNISYIKKLTSRIRKEVRVVLGLIRRENLLYQSEILKPFYKKVKKVRIRVKLELISHREAMLDICYRFIQRENSR